jgi:hypothetical protein
MVKGYMWKIKRPRIEWSRKVRSLFVGFMITFLSCLQFYAKGNKYYLIGAAMGISLLLAGLIGKTDE